MTDSYSSESESEEDRSWIVDWIEEPCNRFLCEVPITFIEDGFNLCGLPQTIPHYHAALTRLLDDEDEEEEPDTDASEDSIESSCQMLYSLVHQRYITSASGLKAMKSKYRRKHFGICPRVLCDGIGLLPYGPSERVQKATVRTFCPKCENFYIVSHPIRKCLDGASFGPGFPHLFLMVYPETLKQGGFDESGYEAVFDPLRKLKADVVAEYQAHKRALPRTIQSSGGRRGEKTKRRERGETRQSKHNSRYSDPIEEEEKERGREREREGGERERDGENSTSSINTSSGSSPERRQNFFPLV